MSKLYEYRGILWDYNDFNGTADPICPIHRMKLDTGEYGSSSTYQGFCEDCDKNYDWDTWISKVEDYLSRKIQSQAYRDAEIISIDGIQTPQIKVRKTLEDENDKYWIEARLNESKKGPQLVIYVGEKGSSQKVQLFANSEQEKLSFDHNDRKPEEIFTTVVATFPSGKKMSIDR